MNHRTHAHESRHAHALKHTPRRLCVVTQVRAMILPPPIPVLLGSSRSLPFNGGMCICEDEDIEDLSPDGPIATRIRAEIAAYEPLPESHFIIAKTFNGRGNGLYVHGQPIWTGTFLFYYEGEILEQEEYDERYLRSMEASDGGGSEACPGAIAEYAVGIVRPDGTSVYVDAALPEESNLARFMNHGKAGEANVESWTLCDPTPRVLMFAAADLSPGDELLWDYGSAYWEGREAEIV
jgi:hypothetical protein